MYRRRDRITRNIIETLKCLSKRIYIPRKGRAEKQNPTPDQMQVVNERDAEDKLRLIIDNNFYVDDFYLTFTYSAILDSLEAKKTMHNFMRRLAYFYKKRGKILKYILVTEYKKRIHHHVLINQFVELTTTVLRKLWPHGWAKKESYGGTAEDAKKIASYFIKEKKSAFYQDQEKFKKRWSCSENLKKPIEHNRIIKAKEWSSMIKVPRGYYLDTDSVRIGVNHAGYPYQFYRVIKVRSG